MAIEVIGAVLGIAITTGSILYSGVRGIWRIGNWLESISERLDHLEVILKNMRTFQGMEASRIDAIELYLHKTTDYRPRLSRLLESGDNQL